MELRLQSIDSLHGIAPGEWNRLAGGNPFLRHEFLIALENSGCVGADTAWHGNHLLLRDRDGRLRGAMPLYSKYDSMGEFVFDWGWADALHRAGREYYPKLVSAIPFTPVTGARILVAPDADEAQVRAKLLSGALELADSTGASSMHVLFPHAHEQQWLTDQGLLARKGCQFHWHNHGYADFDDFLSRFSSAKRKKVRREKRRVTEAGVHFEHLSGDQLAPADWDAVLEFHARTFMRRGRLPYLNREFFVEIARTMPKNLVFIVARLHGQAIAAAICFRGHDTLYGRYWGSLADFHSLHFETCYHQGIEYCIREGLARFEPGTQGEHKVSRGFTPTPTWSAHWLRDQDFRDAVARFLHSESRHVDAYMDEVGNHVPYRRDTPPATGAGPR
jgi:uncharacterized protein